LEAFSRHLQQTATPASPGLALHVLEAWLLAQIRHPVPLPTGPNSCYAAYHVSRVLQTEVALLQLDGRVHFVGRSPSGERLLHSLRAFCASYDQWQFSRWLHAVRASDFSATSSG
jgi:hypothetical protein